MRVNEASQSQRMVWTPDNFVLSEVSKGDYVGHPFRGNQWSDSSGASRGGASSASSQEEIPLLVGVDTVAEANRTGRPLAMMQPENYSPEVKALVKANEQASSLMKEIIQTANEKGDVTLALDDPRFGICEAALRITSYEAKRQFQTEYALKHGLEILPPLGEGEYDKEKYRYEELGRNEDGRLTRDEEEIAPKELNGSAEASNRTLGFIIVEDADGKFKIDFDTTKNTSFGQTSVRNIVEPKSRNFGVDNDNERETINKQIIAQVYAEAKKVGINMPDLPPYARFTAKPLIADGKMTEDEVGLTLAHIKKVGFNFLLYNLNDSADAVGRHEDFGTAKETLDLQTREVTPDVKLSVAVPANRVGAILKDGRLKTQFETGTSGGRNVRATREDWEATMFGYQRGMDDALRPIYGMVETGGTKPSSARGNEFYGTVVLVLKDSVKERATFTDGDSLYLNARHVPVNDASSRVAGRGLTAGRLARNPEGYYETQIHGGVSTSDIERVIIDTSNYKDYEWTEKAPSAALLKSLDKAKIPYEIRQGHPPETSKSRFKPTVLIKGDFVGHPFRGNQWSDSSGASTKGSASSTANPSDQTLRTIAEDINSKLDVLMSDGARFVNFSKGLDSVDRQVYEQQLPMVSLITPRARLIANGVALVEEAINDEDANIVVIEDEEGVISGAISMTSKPYTPAQVSSRFFDTVDKESSWVEMRSAGSTMKVDGIGSGLFAAAIIKASESASGLFLVPLDENAKGFWASKGFRVMEQEKTLGRTATTFQYLDPASVQAIADNLEDIGL